MALPIPQLVALLVGLWWPFCRVLAFLSAAPIFGDGVLPLPMRVLLSLVLAVILLPAASGGPAIDPFSLAGVMATATQAVIGFALGLAFHLTMAVILVLGTLLSSQMGLSMAVMNDPINGVSSDAVSSLMVMLATLVFFSVDGHLVLAGVVGASFQAWPVGGGVQAPLLQALALDVAWVFSAALLLALPMLFSGLVVQFTLGLLNRVAPALNLYSLGFPAVTLFGVFMLALVAREVPEHYVRLTDRVLEMLQARMAEAAHG